MKVRKVISILGMSLVLGMFTTGCKSSEYPSKQVSLIIQAAPGGESDMTGRLIGQEMSEYLKVPVVCSNKTGAAGAVAFKYVSKQKPDGYTIGVCPAEIAMVNPLGISDITPNDVEFLGGAVETPSAVIVRADAPYDNLQEFVEYCKKHDGEVKNGTSGAGSTMHIAGALLEKSSGFKFNYVPFDGSAPAITALMGGHIDVVTIGILAAVAGVDSGDLKVLAILGDERSSRLPDVPTAKEQGINCTYSTWVGLYGPKGLPAEIKDKLEAAVEYGVNAEPYTEFTKQKGLDKKYRNAEEFTAFVKENYKMYKTLIPELGIGK